jgi:hypothetical protein
MDLQQGGKTRRESEEPMLKVLSIVLLVCAVANLPMPESGRHPQSTASSRSTARQWSAAVGVTIDEPA